MQVLIFGATGMVGQGVLRECLLDDEVAAVVVIGRTPTGTDHPKLRDVTVADVRDLSQLADRLGEFDGCFFCLGVSSAGMSEPAYRRVTYDLTLAIARPLAAANPELTFVYISGQGTGSSRMMWSRVKSETENALLDLPFRAYMMRPGFIQPMHGIRSKTGWYRAAYRLSAPLYPALHHLFPRNLTSTESLGRAMIAVARHGAPKRILEGSDINALAE